MLSVNPDVILLFSWRSLEADFKDGVGVVVVVVEEDEDCCDSFLLWMAREMADTQSVVSSVEPNCKNKVRSEVNNRITQSLLKREEGTDTTDASPKPTHLEK